MKSALVLLFATGMLGVGAASTVTSTPSFAEIDTFLTTEARQRLDTYSVELRARMQGGSFLFDQTYSVPFPDPQVQSAFGQAQSLLIGAGATSFTGPALLSNLQSLVGTATNTAQTSRQTTQQFIGAAAFIGPANILVGDRGTCQNYTLPATTVNFSVTGNYALPTGCSGGQSFTIVAGGIDFDVMTLSLVTISQTTTTTNTFLTTQLYELDGIAGPAAAVPEPGSSVLLPIGLVGLVGLGAWSRRSQQSRSMIRFRSSSASPRSLARPVFCLLRSNAARPIKCVAIPSSSASLREAHASSKPMPEMLVKTDRSGLVQHPTGSPCRVSKDPPNGFPLCRSRIPTVRARRGPHSLLWAEPADRDPPYSGESRETRPRTPQPPGTQLCSSLTTRQTRASLCSAASGCLRSRSSIRILRRSSGDIAAW